MGKDAAGFALLVGEYSCHVVLVDILGDGYSGLTGREDPEEAVKTLVGGGGPGF